jgi:hypothetical protein
MEFYIRPKYFKAVSQYDKEEYFIPSKYVELITKSKVRLSIYTIVTVYKRNWFERDARFIMNNLTTRT